MTVMSPKLGEVLVKTTHSKNTMKRLKDSGYKPISPFIARRSF